MAIYSFLALPTGYLLGSIPTTYIIGRLVGKIDMRTEGDGHISAAAIYRRLGRIPYLLVVLIDASKGALAMLIASMFTESTVIILATGLAAVIGHCWSVFLKFKGGLGATVIGGVLASTILHQFLIGMGIAGIVFLIKRKPGLCTGIVIVVTSIVLLIQGQPPILIIYPIILIMCMVIKRFQVNREHNTIAQEQTTEDKCLT